MKIDFERLYGDAFPGDTEILKFVSCVERHTIDPKETGKLGKVALHQAARMVWIADRLEELALGRPALQIHFYMIAAEAVAKLFKGYTGKFESRKHVKVFFQEICAIEARQRLERAFFKQTNENKTFLTWEETVDFLYGVRCDVAHEGQYATLGLHVEPGRQWYTPGDGQMLGVCITLPEIRRMVLEGAVLACRQMLPSDLNC